VRRSSISERAAVDASRAALAVARRNAQRLSAAIEFVESSWWEQLDGRLFDLALANPPYVRAGDPALTALHHEPRDALTPGPDGLEAITAVVATASPRLRPGAWLLLEHGFDQAEVVARLLEGAGFESIETRRDLAGLARATGGRRASAGR
jgi:release factor glutamine methyltransferase